MTLNTLTYIFYSGMGAALEPYAAIGTPPAGGRPSQKFPLLATTGPAAGSLPGRGPHDDVSLILGGDIVNEKWLWFWRFDHGAVIFENGNEEIAIPLAVLRTVLQEVER